MNRFWFFCTAVTLCGGVYAAFTQQWLALSIAAVALSIFIIQRKEEW